MYPMKIVDRKAKHKANKQGYCRKSPRFVVVMVVVLSCFYVQRATAQKILMETGFEDLVQAPEERPFQPSLEIVKNRKNHSKFSTRRIIKLTYPGTVWKLMHLSSHLNAGFILRAANSLFLPS